MSAAPLPSTAAASAALLNTAIALPPYVHDQDQMRGIVRGWLAHDPPRAAQADAVLRNAAVARRYTVRPAEWYLAHPTLGERNAVYREEMLTLCERAARAALDGAGVPVERVGLVVSTSCTGLMIPSVEAYLVNRLGLRPETRRLPITALGCAGGAAALGQAATHLTVHPREAALVVSAELCSLTAQVADFSMANIVSAALFGDGAAATVVVGAQYAEGNGAAEGDGHAAGPFPAPGNGHRPARIVATRSVLFPHSEDTMGFDLTDSGLKIFLLPKVPRFLREALPGRLLPFLEEHGLRLGDVRHFLLHPGGRKVLEGLEQRLGLRPEQTRQSWRVLRDYGNLSSATVLFLLHHFEREEAPQAGDWGLMAAAGPGFSAELLLLRW